MAERGGQMRIIYESATILLIYLAGSALALILPVPGSLMSMAIFFIFLMTRVLKAEKYTGVSALVLRNLAFFFIPPALKILDSLEILNGNIIRLTSVIVLSNICVMAVTGVVVERLLKKEPEDDR